MRRPLFAVTVAIGSLLSSVPQTRAVVTTGAALLDYPLTARVRAMGDNGTADNTDAGNIHFNPANVVGLYSRVYAQGTRWNLQDFIVDDFWLGGLSAGFSHRKESGIAYGGDISYGRLNYGEINVSSLDGNVVTPFTPTEESVTATFGLGVPFGEGNELRVGAAGKRWWARYPQSEMSAVGIVGLDALAFDFGATTVFNATWREWHLAPALGASVVNLGNDIDVPVDGGSTDPLPTRVHFGGSVRVASPTIMILGADVPLFSLVANVDGVHRMHDQPFTWGMGSEIGIAEVLFLRNGFTNDPGDDDGRDSSAYGVGLGIPAKELRVRFDYTHSSRYYEPDIYGIALSWDL